MKTSKCFDRASCSWDCKPRITGLIHDPVEESEAYLSIEKELKGKSVEELNEELVAAKKELFNLRFQNATNQLENTSRIKEVRKNIARIQTVITEQANASK